MIETAADRAAFVADFGVDAVYGGSSIRVLFQTKHDLSSGFELQGSELQTTDYVIEGSVESLPNVVPGDSITVEGVAYTVIAVMPDGMGWVELLAEK